MVTCEVCKDGVSKQYAYISFSRDGKRVAVHCFSCRNRLDFDSHAMMNFKAFEELAKSWEYTLAIDRFYLKGELSK